MDTDKTGEPKKQKGQKDDKPARPTGTWGPTAAILLVVVGLAFGQILGAIFVGLLSLLASRTTALQLDAWFETTPAQFLFVLFSAIFTLLVLAVFLRWRRISWRKLGFERGPQWRDLGWTLLAVPVYFVVTLVVAGLAGVYLGVDLEQEQEIGFRQVVGPAALLMTFVSLVVLPPLVEEILFRGFLFPGLRTKLNFIMAALVTSVLFAIPHLFASSDGLLWVVGIDTFILSMALCYLREHTGALWAPILLHALKNGAAFTYLFIIA